MRTQKSIVPSVTIEAISPRDLFIAAALMGISSHLKGPTMRADETGPEAHARWVIATVDAVMRMRG